MPFIYNPPFNPEKIPGPTWPLDVVFLILDVLSALLGLGTSSSKLFQTAINNQWANFMLTSGFLYNALGLMRDFLLKLLNTVFDGLKHIITDVLHGHLLQALKDIQKLIHDLHNLFAPLIKWLQQLQKIQRQYQLQAMRRIINLIQRARQVLVLFKLLHLKWAKKLDNILAGIEGRLISREIALVAKTNQVISWINFITDPLGVFRAGTVLGPIGTWLAALTGAARALDLGKVFPGLTSSPGPNQSTVPWQHFVDTWQVEGATTTGSYGAFHTGVLGVRALLDKDYSA